MMVSHMDSCPGDPQAGRQGKEGVGVFGVSDSMDCVFLFLFSYFFSFAQMPCYGINLVILGQ